MAGRELTAQERTELAAKMTTRMLSNNVNPSYTMPSRKTMLRPSESTAAYPPKEVEINKKHNLKKDAIGMYVEKALALHDDRMGQPVVSSPIWAPKGAGKSR